MPHPVCGPFILSGYTLRDNNEATLGYPKCWKPGSGAFRGRTQSRLTTLCWTDSPQFHLLCQEKEASVGQTQPKAIQNVRNMTLYLVVALKNRIARIPGSRPVKRSPQKRRQLMCEAAHTLRSGYSTDFLRLRRLLHPVPVPVLPLSGIRQRQRSCSHIFVSATSLLSSIRRTCAILKVDRRVESWSSIGFFSDWSDLPNDNCSRRIVDSMRVTRDAQPVLRA